MNSSHLWHLCVILLSNNFRVSSYRFLTFANRNTCYAAIFGLALPFCCIADVSADSKSDSLTAVIPERREPKVTSKVYLDISIARAPVERLIVGIYGDDAPEASKFFLSVCQGNSEQDVSYNGAQVSRIQKDSRIDVGKFLTGSDVKQETWIDGMGKMRLKSVNLASKAIHKDENHLRNDVNGAVSVKKGGGSFDFTIAPRANKNLDKENIVIGQIIDGIDVIDKINEIPVSKEDLIGSKSIYSAVGKGFDGRAKIITLGRPLKRVTISNCQIEEKENDITSFLKF